jgi:hypothetical protein
MGEIGCPEDYTFFMNVGESQLYLALLISVWKHIEKWANGIDYN